MPEAAVELEDLHKRYGAQTALDGLTCRIERGRLGLTAVARTRGRRLSGGERQRLALAVAVVGRPELLFLDEPTTGLDPQARHATWELIGELKQAGATIVLTTHYLEEAERLADRVLIVDHGRLVTEGAPEELTAGAAGPGL